MSVLEDFFVSILSQFEKADFSLLILIDLCAFTAVFLLALFGCAFSQNLRRRDKRVYLCAVNAFTAITLAIFLIKFSLAQSVAATAVFWCVGYLTYGALKLFKVKPQTHVQNINQQTVSTVSSVRAPRPASPTPPPESLQASGVVRLEHALSIADKLLLKNLGRGDRQELEKIKTALTVLKVKGILSSQEGEALNEMFNTLLKFMAKYDL